MNGLIALAFGTGLLAPLNPCGFALLPGFLALAATRPESGPPSASARLMRGLSAGLLVTIGFTGTLVAVGLLISLGLRAIVTVAPWIGIALGIVLALTGLAMIAGWRIPTRIPTRRVRSTNGRGATRLVLFGVGYALASLSCTFGILLALIGQALAAGNAATLAAVFIAYALGAAVVLLLLGATTGVANALIAGRLRTFSRWVPRIAGIILIAAGGYLIAYWLPAVTGSDTRNPVTTAISQAAADVATWVSAHQSTVVVATLGVLAVVFAVAVITRHRLKRAPGQPPIPGLQDPADCCIPDPSGSPTRAASNITRSK